MNIEDYRFILKIAEEQNITSASKKLFVAQSSLSQCIQRVEETYGITIFRRTKKGSFLTDEGELFVEYARQILAREQHMKDLFDDMNDLRTGTLRIGTSSLLHSRLCRTWIREFRKRYPLIRLTFSEDNSDVLKQMLEKDELDLALVHEPVMEKELSFRPLFENPLVLVAHKNNPITEKGIYRTGFSHPFIDPHLLENEPFALHYTGAGSKSAVEKFLEEEGITPDVMIQSKNFHSLYLFAELGLASTMLLRTSVDVMGKGAGTEVRTFYLDSEKESFSVAGVAWKKAGYMTKPLKAALELFEELTEST